MIQNPTCHKQELLCWTNTAENSFMKIPQKMMSLNAMMAQLFQIIIVTAFSARMGNKVVKELSGAFTTTKSSLMIEVRAVTEAV